MAVAEMGNRVRSYGNLEACPPEIYLLWLGPSVYRFHNFPKTVPPVGMAHRVMSFYI